MTDLAALRWPLACESEATILTSLEKVSRFNLKAREELFG